MCVFQSWVQAPRNTTDLRSESAPCTTDVLKAQITTNVGDRRRKPNPPESSRGQLLTVQIKTSISVTKLKSSIQLTWIWGFSHVFTSFLLLSSKSRFSPGHSLLLFMDLVLWTLALVPHESLTGWDVLGSLYACEHLAPPGDPATGTPDSDSPSRSLLPTLSWLWPCRADGIQVLSYFGCFYNIKRMPLSNNLFSLTLISWRAHSAAALIHSTFPGLRN